MDSLWQTYRSAFNIGVSVGGLLPDDYSAEELDLLRAQFNILTPENCMKPGAIQPREGEFTFAQADALVAFARANGKCMTGHCLLWHQATPEWFFRDGEQLASRELLLSRLRRHIHTLLGRYRGQMLGWDVVNEAIDDEDSYLRDSPWLRGVGDDYLIQAFRFAREADAELSLYYNDYGIESPAKREKTLRLLASLRDAGIDVAAIGIQGHWVLDQVPFAELDAAIALFARTGVQVMITELDLSVLPWEKTAGDPYQDGCPPDLLARQAEQYAELFRIFSRHRDSITRVAFWNPHDGRSWLNEFPYHCTNYPLLFDRQCHPKPAYQSVLAVGKAADSIAP